MPRTRNVLLRGIADGLHLGAQLYVSTTRAPAADLAVGEAWPGRPMNVDHLSLWLSACKPITAAAIMQQVEAGKLRLDDPVARHIPDFAQHGKDRVTVRHLLTHTAGIRSAATNPNGVPWDEVIAQICAARPEPRWVPGETAGYHASSSWFVLGELVRRLSGRPFDEYVRREICQPLGMIDSWIGMPPEQFHAYGGRIAPIFDTSKGGLDQDQFSNTEAGNVMSRPGASGRGPVRELGRFYEMLRGGGMLDRARLLSRESVEQMTSRQRRGMHDRTFNHVMDWGLGLVLNAESGFDADMPYGYGPYASPQTFGHSGSQSCCAFCDPGHGLVVAWACNGMPGEPAHQHRQRAINAAVYEDLGIRAP